MAGLSWVSSYAGNLSESFNRTTFWFPDVNGTSGLTYDATPDDLKHYLLILRLVLLGIGIAGTLLLYLVYIKCSAMLTGAICVYVLNITLAASVDFIDAGLWAARQFNCSLKDIGELPDWVAQVGEMPQAGLYIVSLLFAVLALDRLFATFTAGCHRACYGRRVCAILLIFLIWIGGIFMTFILVFPNQLFSHEPLYEQLRFLIGYAGPGALKLLLLLVLFAKRRIVPDTEASQASITRGRESLYYALTILTLHLFLSAPYYGMIANNFYKFIDLQFDEWLILSALILSEIPLILNPILAFAIEPEFRDALVCLCTCSSASARSHHREMTDLCEDEAESQPLAPMATSPCSDEKDILTDDCDP